MPVLPSLLFEDNITVMACILADYLTTLLLEICIGCVRFLCAQFRDNMTNRAFCVQSIKSIAVKMYGRQFYDVISY